MTWKFIEMTCVPIEGGTNQHVHLLCLIRDLSSHERKWAAKLPNGRNVKTDLSNAQADDYLSCHCGYWSFLGFVNLQVKYLVT